MKVIGTDQFAIVVWDKTAEVVVEDSTITGCKGNAVRFEEGKLTLRRVTSTGSAKEASTRRSAPTRPASRSTT